MFNRRKKNVEHHQDEHQGDDFYDPETMSRRTSNPTVEDLQDSSNITPQMDSDQRYDPDLIADYAPPSDDLKEKKTLTNDEVEQEIDGIMDDIMDIHILNHPRDRARKKRVFFLIGTVVFATIILVVTLAATSGGDNGSEQKAEVKALTKAAPDNLAVLCSITSISTEMGHDECERVCEEAKCCMAAGEESCFLEKEALCGTYAPCGTLHTQTEAPNTQSTTSTYTTTSNAIEIKDSKHPHGVEVSPPPSNLPSLCSPINLSTPDGYLSCETACHHGSCCLSTTNSPSHLFTHGSCFESHGDVCGGYESCMNLDSTAKNGVRVEEAVEAKCSWENVKSKEGRETCENLCAVRSCCFANDERNCRSTNKEWCNEYSACEILINPSPTTQENNMGLSMSKKCQPSNMITKEDLLFCENICKPAFCCYFDDLSCPEGGVNCQDFKFCDHVLSTFLSNGGSWEDEGGYESTGDGSGAISPGGYEDLNDEPPVPPSTGGGSVMTNTASATTTTTTTSLTTNTASAQSVSAPPATGGYDDHGEPDLDDTNLDDEDEAIDNTYGTNKPLSVNADLQQVCSPENLVESPGLCDLRCADHMCCFDNGPNGCAYHPSCASYYPCAILILDSTINGKDEYLSSYSTNVGTGPETLSIKATPAQVQERCAMANLVDIAGVHSCMEACDDYLCCFDDGPQACSTWDKCQQYQSCKFLNDNFEDHTQDTMVMLQDACSASSIEFLGDEDCRGLCEPYKCCFDGSCAFGPLCKVYSSVCSVMFENMDTRDEQEGGTAVAEEPFTEPPEDLEWRCDPDRTAMDATYKYQCDHACEYALCCEHSSEEYRCKESRPQMCKAYAPCFQTYEDEEGEEGSGASVAVAEEPVAQNVNTQPQVAEEVQQEETSVVVPNNPPVVQNNQPAVQSNEPVVPVNLPQPITGPAGNKVQQTTTSSNPAMSSSQPADVSELCSPENKSTPGGLEVCKAACRVMACCWDDDPSKNCFTQNENDCLLYMNCPKDS